MQQYIQAASNNSCQFSPLVVNANIMSNTTWTPCNVYYITNEVHVTQGNTLTILPGTLVLFKSGQLSRPNGSLPVASLVIDSGAAIQAKEARFTGEDGGLTGGVVYCGTLNINLQLYNYDSVTTSNTVSIKSSIVDCVFNNLGGAESTLPALTALGSGDADINIDNIALTGASGSMRIVGGKHSVNTVSTTTTDSSTTASISVDGNGNLTILKRLIAVRNNLCDPNSGNLCGPGLFNIIGITGTKNLLTLAEGCLYRWSGKGVSSDPSTKTGIFSTFGPNRIACDQGTAPEESTIAS